MKTGIENSLGDIFTALINGTYQGVLITLAVLAYLRFARSINAATRHALLMATLAVVTLLPAVHWLIRPQSQPKAPASVVGTPAAVLPRITRVTSTAPEHLKPSGSSRSHNPSARKSTPPNLLEPSMGTTKPVAAQGSTAMEAPLPHDRQNPKEPLAKESSPGRSDRFHSALRQAYDWIKSASWWSALTAPPAQWTAAVSRRNWSAGLALGWMVLAIGLSIRLAFQYLQLWRLKKSSESAQHDDLQLFRAVSQDLKLHRKPRLLVSRRISIPLAAGFLHPAVILPWDLSDSLERDALRTLLRHELAHLARNDDWANLFQLGAQALYFFNPAVWLLARRLNVEREIACDDHVLQATSSPRDYALLLTEFVRRRSGRPWVTASGAWSHKSQLKERIDMILNSQRNTSPLPSRVRVGALTVGAVILAMAGLRIGPRIALADAPPTAIPTPTTSAPVDGADVAPVVAVHTSTTSQALPTPVRLPLATDLHSTVTIARADSPDALAAEKPIGSTESGPRSKDAPVEAPRAIPAPPAPTTESDPTLQAPQVLKAIPVPPTPSALNVPVPQEAAPENLDQRLARLEKLVHELLQRDQPQPSAGAEMEKVVRQLQAETRRFEVLAKNSGKAAVTSRITADANGNLTLVQNELEAKQEAEQAQHEAEEARREAIEEAKQAELEAEQAAMEAKQEAEQAQREAEEERRQALEEAKQAEREARQAEVEAAREKLQQDREQRKELKEQRKALLDEQSELKKRLLDIEKELSRLKLPGEDVSPLKK